MQKFLPCYQCWSKVLPELSKKTAATLCRTETPAGYFTPKQQLFLSYFRNTGEGAVATGSYALTQVPSRTPRSTHIQAVKSLHSPHPPVPAVKKNGTSRAKRKTRPRKIEKPRQFRTKNRGRFRRSQKRNIPTPPATLLQPPHTLSPRQKCYSLSRVVVIFRTRSRPLPPMSLKPPASRAARPYPPFRQRWFHRCDGALWGYFDISFLAFPCRRYLTLLRSPPANETTAGAPQGNAR